MIKYIYHFMTFFIVGALVGVVFFLYKNFYLTLAGSQEVESLISRVSGVRFDVKKVERIADDLQKKQAYNAPIITHDPFSSLQ